MKTDQCSVAAVSMASHSLASQFQWAFSDNTTLCGLAVVLQKVISYSTPYEAAYSLATRLESFYVSGNICSIN